MVGIETSWVSGLIWFCIALCACLIGIWTSRRLAGRLWLQIIFSLTATFGMAGYSYRPILAQYAREQTKSRMEATLRTESLQIPPETARPPEMPNGRPQDRARTKAPVVPSEQIESSPKIVVSAPQGIAIGGGTVHNPTVNNNYLTTLPPPAIKWSIMQTLDPNFDNPTGEDAGKNPGVRIKVQTEGPFAAPTFAVVCKQPCTMTKAGLAPGWATQKIFYTPRPNTWAFALTAAIDRFDVVVADLRSKNTQPVEIEDVQAVPPIK